MITVHHLNNSRSQRILWMLEELGLEYEIKKYERDPETIRAPDSLKQVHPLGKAPVLTDGDAVIAESGAIIEYLADTYGGGLKPDTASADYRRYVYFMHFAEGSVMTPLLVKLIADRMEMAKMPFFAKPVAKGIAKQIRQGFALPEIKKLLDFMEGELAERDWFAGDSLTGADIQMSYPLEAAVARGGLTKKTHPNLAAFVDRIQKRDAYKRAIARGGEYDFYSG